MKSFLKIFFLLIIFSTNYTNAQHTIAREWNEQLLNAIRGDYARPTVHARNLFHSSAIMYDSWAIFNPTAETVFLGKTYGGYDFPFSGIQPPTNKEEAINEIISYGMYRLLTHRFRFSPTGSTSLNAFKTLFENLGYNVNFTSTDYSTGSYAALGNYFAEKMIAFGLQDGSNEANFYNNKHYYPENEPLLLNVYEDNSNIDPNKWQPLAFDIFIDQSGNLLPVSTPGFLSPEWGEVTPFSLKKSNLSILNDGFDCYVYYNPGPPVFIQNSNENGIEDPYKWHFALVIAWSAQLDPNDNVFMDISPGKIGNTNINNFPSTFEQYKAFYNFSDGGDSGTGHALNPDTGVPYSENVVKRADYARVLAEFWADGPESETPPGHWFTILNYVSDHPRAEKKIAGQGPRLSNLEWDVKSYLALGGAMHDAAVSTWGIKGYYDYIRPISAIRYMASKGQSSNASLPGYDPHGLPLIDGLIEIIENSDPLAGNLNENVGKVKVKSWKGPDFVIDPDTNYAGVDWILGTHWWPYQRPTFVTPPFAGYVSGHSTFSRAASEILTQITGDAFFPGGLGTFDVTKNEFLVFEDGPTESFSLEWATYRDASDQTSLSRIWGGIHPPIDDIRGRIIGNKIGKDVFNLVEGYFTGTLNVSDDVLEISSSIYPIPFKNSFNFKSDYIGELTIAVFDLNGKEIFIKKLSKNNQSIYIDIPVIKNGIYFIKAYNTSGKLMTVKKIIKE
ncbi:MAG: T9SS type A sorting domain-containing protein [Polaribacter sp.]|uniref:T9SS type A sorting domain-containing protein n=1 Tax=Polaribacter sp. TaxID=1920175 RepID=UPI002F35422F